jgi:acetyltransferase-like isoleucine patch superfamily enzyme
MIHNVLFEIHKVFLILISLPKIIVVNFYYLPFGQAIKLPIFIPYNLTIRCMGGNVIVDHASFGIIQIGFNSFGIVAGKGDGVWNVTGQLHFKGRTRIGCHPKLQIRGSVVFGSNFEAGHNLLIVCHKRITFGSNILLSWNVEIMDTDCHQLLNKEGAILNKPRDIEVKDHTWIGSNVTLLKGSILPEGSIVASRTMVTKAFQEPNCLFMGTPAKVHGSDVYWKP